MNSRHTAHAWRSAVRPGRCADGRPPIRMCYDASEQHTPTLLGEYTDRTYSAGRMLANLHGSARCNLGSGTLAWRLPFGSGVGRGAEVILGAYDFEPSFLSIHKNWGPDRSGGCFRRQDGVSTGGVGRAMRLLKAIWRLTSFHPFFWHGGHRPMSTVVRLGRPITGLPSRRTRPRRMAPRSRLGRTDWGGCRRPEPFGGCERCSRPGRPSDVGALAWDASSTTAIREGRAILTHRRDRLRCPPCK